MRQKSLSKAVFIYKSRNSEPVENWRILSVLNQPSLLGTLKIITYNKNR